MQGFITTPIAKAVLNADNVDYVTSSSTLGSSTVSVNMVLDADPDQALVDVLSKVQQVRGELPTDAEDPVVLKGTGHDFALMYLAVRSHHDEPAAGDGIPDAGDPAALRHGRRRRRRADPRRAGIRHARLARPDPARRAQRHRHRRARPPSAPRTSSPRPARPRTSSSPTPSRRRRRCRRRNPSASCRCAPTATRSCGFATWRRSNTAPRTTTCASASTARRARSSASSPSPGANALDTSAAVRAELPQIQSELPPGMKLELVYDASDNISASIEEVFKTIAEAVVIVVLVILLFLGSFRSVLVPIFTIPLSLDRRLLHPLPDGLFHQPPDAARHGARHRPRRRRRHRGGGEHPPASRARRDADAGGDRRHARDLRAGHRHDDHARRRLCADRLRAGPDRRALPRVRGDARRRRRHLRLHRADALADARRARAEAARRRRQPLPADRRPRASTASASGTAGASPRRSTTAGSR